MTKDGSKWGNISPTHADASGVAHIAIQQAFLKCAERGQSASVAFINRRLAFYA